MGLLFRFTKDEWSTIAVIASTNFCIGICYSLTPPFYPPEAEKKGATPTEYGIVFGICQLTATIANPLVGKYIEKIGVKFLLQFTVCMCGLSLIFLGLLDLVNSHEWFMVLSLIFLVILASNYDASGTAGFSLTVHVFPTRVGTMFASLELFYGLGSAVGPTFGGFLVSIGGYLCLFVVVGTLMTMVGTSFYFILPDYESKENLEKSQTQIFSVFKLLPVMLDSLSMFAQGICLGFLSATLEPHIRQFDLSPLSVGMIFSIGPVVYAITLPVVGKLCDTAVYPKKCIIVSNCFHIISFSLLGPLPFLPFKTNLWMVCIGLVCYGLAYGTVAVATFLDAIRSSVECGLPDDFTTYGIVSGVWMSSMALGGAIGPPVAGALFDRFGFRQATLFAIVIETVVLVSMSWYVCVEKRPRKETPGLKMQVTAANGNLKDNTKLASYALDSIHDSESLALIPKVQKKPNVQDLN